MQVSSSELKDTYGHYFVLCDHRDHNMRNDSTSPPYVSQVHWNIKDSYQSPQANKPDKFVIYEFLGKPEFSNKRSTEAHITGGYGKDEKGLSVFDNLEDAQAKAAEIQTLIKKSQGRQKNKIIPPITVEKIPETMEFPNPNHFKAGAARIVIANPSDSQELKIWEETIKDVQIRPLNKNHDQTGLPEFSYVLDLNMWLTHSNGGRKEKFSDTLFLSDKGDDWEYYISNSHGYSAGVRFSTTYEEAEAIAAKLALKTVMNSYQHLPEELQVDTAETLSKYFRFMSGGLREQARPIIEQHQPKLDGQHIKL